MTIDINILTLKFNISPIHQNIKNNKVKLVIFNVKLLLKLANHNMRLQDKTYGYDVLLIPKKNVKVPK